MIEAVIFDLDGVLVDSERLWDQARRELVEEQRGRWLPGSTEAMQGMSPKEWSEYLQQTLGVELQTPLIITSVLEKLQEHYRRSLPMQPGAVKAVERIASRWPLALASSSNRIVIDTVLNLSGIAQLFRVTVSSEEVPRGKPSPDVYLEAARQLGVAPIRCCAIEDSSNGIRSASQAGMTVIAIPASQPFKPEPGVLALAAVVLSNLDDLTVEVVGNADRATPLGSEERLDEQEEESFPASDPHSDWAGPSS